jgi:hypothetical protein
MRRGWLTRQLRQLRLVPALLVPTVRAVGWAPPLAAFTLSLGLLVLTVERVQGLQAGGLVVWLRITMAVGALGSAFLLDDPSEPTTEAVAGSLLLRRALRVALLLPATAAWWAAAVWRVRAVHPAVPLPIAALTLEAGTLLAVTIALAAAGSHLAPERRGGVVATPALFAVTGAGILLPARVALYALPGSPGWDGAHHRWATLLGLALAAFATASRDPARRRVRSQLRRLTRGHITKRRHPLRVLARSRVAARQAARDPPVSPPARRLRGGRRRARRGGRCGGGRGMRGSGPPARPPARRARPA